MHPFFSQIIKNYYLVLVVIIILRNFLKEEEGIKMPRVLQNLMIVLLIFDNERS